MLGWFYHDRDWLSWSEHGADNTKPVGLILPWAIHFRIGPVILVGPFQFTVFHDSVITEGKSKVWKALSTLRKGLLCCSVLYSLCMGMSASLPAERAGVFWAAVGDHSLTLIES